MDERMDGGQSRESWLIDGIAEKRLVWKNEKESLIISLCVMFF